MKFKSQDEEIQYWKLRNNMADAQIAYLQAVKELEEFENNIDYGK